MRSNSFRKSIISGILILAVSISMLIGTTYAVFNDNASTGVNTIQAGTLDVDLVDAAGQSLVGGTVNFTGGANVLWEPDRGNTLETVYIKNNGDLDLVYKIAVTGLDNLGDLAQWIEWSVQVDGSTVTLADYEATLNTGADNVPVVLVGTMKHNTPNSVMGATANGVGITVYAKQTTAQAEYDD